MSYITAFSEPEKKLTPETGRAAPLNGWWDGDPATLPLAEPVSTPGLLVVQEFLSADQCGIICAAFNDSMDMLAPNPQGVTFWDERVLYFNSIAPWHDRAKSLMQQARFCAAYRIAEHFGTDRRIYSDSQQLVLWKEGHSMPVHVDNAHPDGSKHGTPHRDFASIIYLNDDYEGGEVFFPLAGIRLKPKRGMLVGFRGTSDTPHGVTKVIKGERYTLPCWYSFDPAVAEQAMLTIF